MEIRKTNDQIRSTGRVEGTQAIPAAGQPGLQQHAESVQDSKEATRETMRELESAREKGDPVRRDRMELSEQAKVANLDEVYLKYRIHSGSLNGQKLAGIRLNQRYAAHCARLRTQGHPKIDLDAYRNLEQQRPLTWRLGEKVNVFAMHQYRLALTNILGGNPILGYARLGLAAFCSPKLTFSRVRRMFAHRFLPAVSGQGNTPQSATQGNG